MYIVNAIIESMDKGICVMSSLKWNISETNTTFRMDSWNVYERMFEQSHSRQEISENKVPERWNLIELYGVEFIVLK